MNSDKKIEILSLLVKRGYMIRDFYETNGIFTIKTANKITDGWIFNMLIAPITDLEWIHANIIKNFNNGHSGQLNLENDFTGFIVKHPTLEEI